MKASFPVQFRLYVITDPVLGRGRSHAEQARAAAEGGADLIQIRDKSLVPGDLAREGRRVAEALDGRSSLVANDWPWAALDMGAAGIHVGQDDLSLDEVRSRVPGLYVGKSSHSLDQALRTEQEGPDYLALGPIFPTSTKRKGSPAVGLRTLEQAAKRLKLPWLAIGGINMSNLDQVLDAGATRVAVVTAAVGADDIGQACRRLKEGITRHGR